MKDILSFELIDLSGLSVDVGQLILTIIAFLAWVFILLVGRKLFKKKGSFAKQIGKKHLVASKRFFYFTATLLFVFIVLKILNVETEGVFKAKILSTGKVDIEVYHLIIFYLIIAGTRFVVALLENLFNSMVQKTQLEKGRSRSIFLIVKYLAYVIAITVFIESLGVSITIVIASVSALLVGIGLGIQHFFNDIISGIVILFDHSIKVDDVVEIDGEVIGRVVKINLRTSKISTRDDVIMIVPNSMFTSEKVINWSHNTRKNRFEIKVGVAYGSDVRLVEKILIDVAKKHPDVEEKPLPFVLFYDFGNSSLDFILKFWSVKPFYIEPIKSDLRFEIDKRFRENNVTIPFPQQDVYIKQFPGKD